MPDDSCPTEAGQVRPQIPGFLWDLEQRGRHAVSGTASAAFLGTDCDLEMAMRSRKSNSARRPLDSPASLRLSVRRCRPYDYEFTGYRMIGQSAPYGDESSSQHPGRARVAAVINRVVLLFCEQYASIRRLFINDCGRIVRNPPPRSHCLFISRG